MPSPASPSPTAAGSPARTPTGRREYWISQLGAVFIRLLVRTLRIRVEDPEHLRALTAGGSILFAFWHNRLLLVPPAYNRFIAPRRTLQGMALSSTSRDGELIAQFISRFGLGPVRGSGTRRGSAALREMATLLKKGHDLGITPDGSRGPCYEIKPGLVLIAQLTGRPVVPMSFEFTRAWRLRTWDRFIIPKPFSSVTMRLGQAVYVPRTDTPEAFAVQVNRCQDAMRALVRDDDLAAPRH